MKQGRWINFGDDSLAVAKAAPLGRPPRVYFNGKFYSGPINGVHRVADRLIRQINEQAAAGGEPAHWDIRLLVPEVENWAPKLRHIAVERQRHGHRVLWEQLMLPFIAADGLLVSLANLAPALHPNKLTMVHDAQFRISPHSYRRHRRAWYRALIPAGARTSRRVLTVSDYARDCLETFGIASRDCTHIVRNAADHMLEVETDPKALRRWNLAPGRFCLLFGSTAIYKNIGTVLDAFGEPELAGYTLVVIGPQATTLQRAGLPLPANALCVGAIDDAALRSLYEHAHCLLFPSRTEGFGLPPLEAMQCGCPVVAAAAGAVPEVCRDAILYAAASDPEDWGRQILRLAGSNALRVEKIAQGHKRAADFRWEHAGRELAQEIADLLR